MNYRQTSTAAEVYRRSNAVHLWNPLDRPEDRAIRFEEEDVIALASGGSLTTPAGGVSGAFEPLARFPVLNPVTGEPTGATASHLDVYVLLHSLYLDLAARRDAA